MIKIDWRMAPEWADGHGLISWQGFTEVWINADQYAVVGREGGPYPWGGGNGDTRHNHTRGQVQYITPHPDRWNGDGPPPVGTVCEVLWNESRLEYFKTKVFGINEHGQPIHRFEEGPKKYEFQADVLRTASGTQVFMPLKTPEQIAAEERLGHIATLVQHICADGAFDVDDPEVTAAAAKIYDAGYRKQEAS